MTSLTLTSSRAGRLLSLALLAILAAFAIGATPDAARAQDQYRIGAGDQLQVEVLEDSSLNRQVLVLPDGTISFPLVGTLKARGLTVEGLRKTLTDRLASNFAAPPTVSVSVSALATADDATDGPTIDIYVMGEIQGAGKQEVEAGTTILQALADAGGLTPFAAQSRIELHRGDQTYLYSYNHKLGRNKTPRIPASTKLKDGDVVVVPSRRLFE